MPLRLATEPVVWRVRAIQLRAPVTMSAISSPEIAFPTTTRDVVGVTGSLTCLRRDLSAFVQGEQGVIGVIGVLGVLGRGQLKAHSQAARSSKS